MNTPVEPIVTALALGARVPSAMSNAIGIVHLGSKIRATALHGWWRWTVYLAAGIACRRIEEA